MGLWRSGSVPSRAYLPPPGAHPSAASAGPLSPRLSSGIAPATSHLCCTESSGPSRPQKQAFPQAVPPYCLVPVSG